MKIHDVEQKSPEWFALRMGKPTASKFSEIVTSKGAESRSRFGYAVELAAELYAGPGLNNWGGNLDLQRGSFLEADAIRAYEFDREVQVQPVGFITDDQERWGCSPDGLVGEDGLVEVKCLNAEKHCQAILRWQRDGDCQPDYVQQTQGQLWITGRKWCDLILYHAALPMLIIRQTPIKAVQDGIRDGLLLLLKERDEVLKALHAQRLGLSIADLGDDEA